MNISFDSLESGTGRQRLLNRVATALWVTVLLIIFCRVALFSLLIGLIMMAILAAYSKRWTVSAVCKGIAAYLKIYPLAVGLLLVLIYPPTSPKNF